MKPRKNKFLNRRNLYVVGLILFSTMLNVSFQNCAKVQATDLQAVANADKLSADNATSTDTSADTPPEKQPVAVPATTTSQSSPPKNCLEVNKNDGDMWMVPDGSSRVAVTCKVGTGTQFQIFNLEAEVQCKNGQVIATGKTTKLDTGKLEGECDLSCGTHKNGEVYFMALPDSETEKKCSTSLTATSLIKYQNQAEYKCSSGMATATGVVKQTIASETQCPPLAFNNQDNIATIAYEDTYIPASGTKASNSDHDYNDFVGTIKVLETYNSLDQLTKISIEYSPKLKLSGLNSQLILVFDGTVRGRDNWVSNVNAMKSQAMFEGSASINYQLLGSDGKVLTTKNDLPKNQDLILFADNAAALNGSQKAVVTITNLDPALNTLSQRKGLSITRYRTLLHVLAVNQGYDVDLSDINPGMFDNTGYPMAFFVPVNWKAPKESTNILRPYPNFKDHAAYLLSGADLANEPIAAKNWFNFLADTTTVAP